MGYFIGVWLGFLAWTIKEIQDTAKEGNELLRLLESWVKRENAVLSAEQKAIENEKKEVWKPLETVPQIRPQTIKPDDDKKISKEKGRKEQIKLLQAKPQTSERDNSKKSFMV